MKKKLENIPTRERAKSLNRIIAQRNLEGRYRIKYPRKRIPVPKTPTGINRPLSTEEYKTVKLLAKTPIEKQTYHPHAIINQPEKPEPEKRITPIILYTPVTDTEIMAEIYKAKLSPYNRDTQTIYLEIPEKRTKRVPVNATKRFPKETTETVSFRDKNYTLEEFAKTMMRNEIEFYELECVITE